jgi:hypothetical protein
MARAEEDEQRRELGGGAEEGRVRVGESAKRVGVAAEKRAKRERGGDEAGEGERCSPAAEAGVVGSRKEQRADGSEHARGLDECGEAVGRRRWEDERDERDERGKGERHTGARMGGWRRGKDGRSRA